MRKLGEQWIEKAEDGKRYNMRLINGDCLQEMDKLIQEGVKVDAIITDPPYGTTACEWDSIIPLDEMWERLNKLIKPNGAIVLFGSEPFSSALRMSNIKNYKYDWVWNKISPTGHLNAKKRPMKKLEDICVFNVHYSLYKPQGLIYNPRKKSRKSNTQGSDCYGRHGDSNISLYQGYPTETLFFKNENGLHSTQKPVALMEYLIKTYTNEGETVLDFTMGSGTTGVACKQTGRNFIGIELDDGYFQIAKERIIKAKKEEV
jgi:DNA modification methylase